MNGHKRIKLSLNPHRLDLGGVAENIRNTQVYEHLHNLYISYNQFVANKIHILSTSFCGWKPEYFLSQTLITCLFTYWKMAVF